MPAMETKSGWAVLLSVIVFVGLASALALFLLVDDVVLFLLFDRLMGLEPEVELRVTVAVTILVVNIFLVFVSYKVVRKRAETGAEGMAGEEGIVVKVQGKEVWVRVHGELWRARCEAPPAVGEEVVVRKVHGLTLTVAPKPKGAQ